MFLFKKKAAEKKVTDAGRTLKLNQVSRGLSYRVGNLQKPGSRSNQEDSFALVNALDVNEMAQNGLFAIVADGMGGMKDGKLVSEAAVAGFVQAFHSIDRTQGIPGQLARSAAQINSSLYDRFEGDGGTTVVLVMIYQEKAYWVSVGDSTIYLKRNGGLYRLNEEHTYRNKLYLEEVYREVIDKEKVERDEDGVRLSEFLGNSSIDRIDYNRKPLKLKDGDVILLCSDGISSYLEEPLILNALAHPPETACELLNAAVVTQNHKNQDNYTALDISCIK